MQVKFGRLWNAADPDITRLIDINQWALLERTRLLHSIITGIEQLAVSSGGYLAQRCEQVTAAQFCVEFLAAHTLLCRAALCDCTFMYKCMPRLSLHFLKAE